jgi:hypothetical protein
MRLSAGLTITVNDRSGGGVDLVSNSSAHAASGKQGNLLILNISRWFLTLPSYRQVFASDNAHTSDVGCRQRCRLSAEC